MQNLPLTKEIISLCQELDECSTDRAYSIKKEFDHVVSIISEYIDYIESNHKVAMLDPETHYKTLTKVNTTIAATWGLGISLKRRLFQESYESTLNKVDDKGNKVKVAATVADTTAKNSVGSLEGTLKTLEKWEEILSGTLYSMRSTNHTTYGRY